MMLWNMILFELRYQLRKPTTHLFAAILFALAVVFMTTDAVSIGGAGPLVKINSPWSLAFMMAALSVIATVILPGITGTSVIRDIEFKTYELIFTTPISKFAYIGGRFIGSFMVTALINSAMVVGLIIGSLIAPFLGTEADKVLPVTNILSYLLPYLLIAIPNSFVFAAISFSTGLVFRSFVVVYVQGFVLFMLWTISQRFTQEIENRVFAALSDPFGFQAFSLDTRVWTAFEKNTLQMPMDGYILINRFVWIAVACIFFLIAYRLFSTRVEGFTLRKRRKQLSEANEHSTPTESLPFAQTWHNATAHWKQYLSMTIFYFKSIIREKPFIAISIIGMIVFGFITYSTNHTENLTLYPVTYLMMGGIGSFTLFGIIISALYAGELTWKERTLKLNQTFDALPVPAHITLAGKITALTLTHLALYTLLFVCAVFTQTVQGYYNYEFSSYIFFILCVLMPTVLQVTLLAFCIHSVVNQKYVGHLGVVLFYVLQIVAELLGMEHDMWGYATAHFGRFSAFNGYAPFLVRGFSFTVFFISIGLILSFIAYLFWVRSTEDTWKQRLHIAKQRLTRPAMSFASLMLMIMLGSGGWIYYNINILNTYRTNKQGQTLRAEYEKNYREKYRWFAQPRVTDVYVELDIYPYEREYVVRGRQTLVNKHQQAIDTILINWDENLRIHRLDYGREAEYLVNNTSFGFAILKLKQALQPGDSMIVQFEFAYDKKGFNNDGIEQSIMPNGTFLNSSICPNYGYNEDVELSDEDERRKNGLGKKAKMLPISDDRGRKNSYLGSDADLINFETIVSTSADQIAIAPGYLQREWTAQSPRGERRFFHYKMDSPIWNFYSFLSGRYQVTRDVWKNPQGGEVALEIYHLPEHTYNLPRFMEAAKRGLDYYTANFGPYQHRQYRVIEFPRYQSFAQSFPNTIPFSESIEFIAREDQDGENIDQGFFVNAHELAHQWWAHQVLGSEQQGRTMLSESLAEYSALRVMEKKYGVDMMQKFLRYELDGYLSGRAVERKAEQPLMYNEDQQYIRYQKGSHIFYCLSDYIGEGTLNKALAQFLDEWKYKYAPYPNTGDLIKIIRTATPDSLQYIVGDLFEKITLYENSTKEAQYTKQTDGTYKVKLVVEAKKFYADSTGEQKQAPLNDYIDIGAFAESKEKGRELGKPLYFKRHKLNQETTTIEFTLNEEPYKTGIDPYYKLVDREPKDNVKVTEKK